MIEYSIQITNYKLLRKVAKATVRKFAEVAANIINWDRDLRPHLIDLVERSQGYLWLGTTEARGELGVAGTDMQGTVSRLLGMSPIETYSVSRGVKFRWLDVEFLYSSTEHVLTSKRNGGFGPTVSWLQWVEEGKLISGYNVVNIGNNLGRAGVGYLVNKGGLWDLVPQELIKYTLETRSSSIERKIAAIINKEFRNYFGVRRGTVAKVR